MISVRHITKEYKRYKSKKGAFSGIRNIFAKDYATFKAVDDLNFNIDKGEIVGYIGPNGAGKSTSIKMLTGIITPTSGSIEINGINPQKDRKSNARQIGVVFGQKTQLWWDLPVIDSLKLLRDIYNIPIDRFNKNMCLFDDILELTKFQDTPVRQLSLGQRVKADLAAALLHDPDILFLDEPTIGLDIVTKERFRVFIKEICVNNGVTILLTTHDMNDIEKLCSRMIIINNGRIGYDGSVEQVRNEYGMGRVIEVEFEHAAPDMEIPGCKLIRSEGNKCWLQFNKNDTPSSNIVTCIAEKYQIKDFAIKDPEIEEIVRSIYISTGDKPASDNTADNTGINNTTDNSEVLK